MKRGLIILVFTLSIATIIAQPKGKICMEEIKARKIAYITDVVKLTPEEAQLFWPIYNELQQKIADFHKKRHALEKQISESNGISIDYEKINDELVQLRVEIATIQQTYYKKYKTILSAEKINRLFKAEHGFKKVLLESFDKK
jgi:hypothetical protein